MLCEQISFTKHTLADRREVSYPKQSNSFVLQHNATMNRGMPQLNIIVLPDSGTDQLTGISGMMTIKIDQGQHFYEFDYTFSDAK